MIASLASEGGVEALLSERQFARLAGLVKIHAGIALGPGKLPMVQARLSRRLRALRLGSFDAYCELIEGETTSALDERLELITAMTTNVTRFFREPHHFDDLRARVLPELIARARAGGRVRIWSAGCSSGEEPYSIALTLLELEPDAGRLDIRILATDLDRAVLGRARAGVYPEAVAAQIPSPLRNRYLAPADPCEGTAGLGVGPAVRALVAFRPLNLIQPWPVHGPFDVIFCRNVVIYFDAAGQAALWQRFSDILTPGGHLFVGHSERVDPVAFPTLESAGITTFRLRGPSAARRPPQKAPVCP